MCVVAVAIGQSNEFPFVLVHNRDEYYNRPSERLGLRGKIVGGRDERAGGMWLGLRKDGPPRFAFVTNLRQGIPSLQPAKRSRGELVQKFLENDTDPREFIENLTTTEYLPFNLAVGNFDNFRVFCSREELTLSFSKGVHAFSNGDPRVLWPKAKRLQGALSAMVANVAHEEQLAKTLMQLLSDDQKARVEELPKTGIPLEWEQELSSIWVQTKDYGTVASTVILQNKTGAVRIWERARMETGKFATSQLNV